MKAVILGFVLTAGMVGPAMAQEWIDYDLVMRQNADRVQVTTDAGGRETRTLDMGDGVSVTCDKDGCFGIDQSDSGAIGCTFSIVTELQAFARICEVPLSADETARLDHMFGQLGAFVAANAVPPRPADYPADLLARRMAGLSQEAAGDRQAICAPALEGEIGFMIDAFASPETADEMTRMLARPRLPVMNPCL
jgi:hypothetical protein